MDLLQSRVDNIIPDGTQTAGNTELLDIRVGSDATVYDSAGNAVRKQIDYVSETTRNLLNKFSYIDGYFTANNTAIKSVSDTNILMYIPCETETTYTITRMSGGHRFRGAYTYDNHLPEVNDIVHGFVDFGNSATTGTITTDTDATYLVVWVFAGAYDSMDPQDMIDSVQIEAGSAATSYISHYTAKDVVARNDILTLDDNKFERYGQLTAGTDLDTLYALNGYYTLAYNDNFPNQPLAHGRRTLLIYQTGGATNYTVQILTDSSTGRIYMRTYVSNVWQDWKNVDIDNTPEILGMAPGRMIGSHGGAYTNSAYQNSPKAFADSRKSGVIYQDLDIVFTSDLYPIVFHNWQATDINSVSHTFGNETLATIQAAQFGDSDYSWTLQTLKECNEFLNDIGCLPCIDVHGSTHNPAGSVEGLCSYLKLHHIKPVYLCTSDTTTFSKLVNNGGPDYPLGIVITAQTDDIAGKVQLIIDTVTDNNMPYGWIFTPYWGDALFESLMSPYLQDLGNANIKIAKYGLSTSSQLNSTTPSCVDMVLTNYANYNYERFTRTINSQ